MNILITGAKGQLGKCIHRAWELTNMDDIHLAYWTDYDELDITNEKEIEYFIDDYNIDIIVNCAAYTNVDKAETNYEAAYRLNGLAPGYLGKAINKRNGMLIHISTDYVFGKEQYNTPCNENRTGTPSGVYGETKLKGEQEIISNTDKYIILRTSWLYSEFGNNFMKTMMKLMNDKDEIKVVFDQVGTPTYAGDLAYSIIHLINYYNNDKENMSFGIYNFSNEGVCSWYDFAYAIKQLTFNTSCNILPCHSSEFISPVTRPSYSVLDKTKIKNTFNISIPYWRESLENAINTYNKLRST